MAESDCCTWSRAVEVGDGYAVPELLLTPSNGGRQFLLQVFYLERNSFSFLLEQHKNCFFGDAGNFKIPVV